ncbi:hypothetical protein KR009_009643 [Drosophila setifemur]|nr:hypothetical protein KR009_009643 [Drosophila setifemur]
MFATTLTLVVLLLASQQDVCRAQLSYHQDANTNSYTLKTPGLQQTFTRYFGAARPQAQLQDPYQAQLVQQQQQEQQQQQLVSFCPGNEENIGSWIQLEEQKSLVFVSSLNSMEMAERFSQQQQHQGAQTGVSGGAGAGAVNMPSYADQMHAAFQDYQRQRQEFEEQQEQLLKKLYHYYPDVTGQVQAETGASPAPVQAPVPSASSLPSSRFAYRRPQFGSSNGLQQSSLGGVGGVRLAGGAPAGGAALRGGEFYSTQQHMGFMQQQQQDVLRDQQQTVAHQFATSQLAPTTRQSYGMAVPMSSVLSSPPYQSSPEVSHVNFSSGNLNYSF